MSPASIEDNENTVLLPLSVIERGFYQPREYFDDEAMRSTLLSIQAKGQKYPVIVRPIKLGNPLFDPAWTELHYELADGERRFRCCKELKLPGIKALVRDLSDEEMLDYTLTTNDSLPLNPIEKAMVFSRLAKEFHKSQAEIAVSFNLKQQQVSEYIRLLELPKEIQDLTARAVISVRHARELLKISDSEKMHELAREVKEKALSTRDLSRKLKEDKESGKNGRLKVESSDIVFVSEEDGVNVAKNAEIGQKKSEIAGMKADLEPQDPMDSVKMALQTQIVHENRRTWLERLHFRLIPGRYYQKMEYWLSFDLGSTLRPESWLIRLEIAIATGLILLIASNALATWILGAALAFSGALLTFLFII